MGLKPNVSGWATGEAIAMRQYLAALVRDAREVLTGLQT